MMSFFVSLLADLSILRTSFEVDIMYWNLWTVVKEGEWSVQGVVKV